VAGSTSRRAACLLSTAASSFLCRCSEALILVFPMPPRLGGASGAEKLRPITARRPHSEGMPLREGGSACDNRPPTPRVGEQPAKSSAEPLAHKAFNGFKSSMFICRRARSLLLRPLLWESRNAPCQHCAPTRLGKPANEEYLINN
jgi:hypothetical protein